MHSSELVIMLDITTNNNVQGQGIAWWYLKVILTCDFIWETYASWLCCWLEMNEFTIYLVAGVGHV
jgi:hypothetical protein